MRQRTPCSREAALPLVIWQTRFRADRLVIMNKRSELRDRRIAVIWPCSTRRISLKSPVLSSASANEGTVRPGAFVTTRWSLIVSGAGSKSKEQETRAATLRCALGGDGRRTRASTPPRGMRTQGAASSFRCLKRLPHGGAGRCLVREFGHEVGGSPGYGEKVTLSHAAALPLVVAR